MKMRDNILGRLVIPPRTTYDKPLKFRNSQLKVLSLWKVVLSNLATEEGTELAITLNQSRSMQTSS